MVKIALVTNGIYPYVVGGMQKHSFYLCKYLAQNGIEVDLYHTNQQSRHDIDQLELFTDDERKNIHSTVIDFPEPGRFPGHYLRASHLYSQRIWKAFQCRPPVDFIYTKGLTGWKFVQEKAKGAKLPPIGNKSHGYEMFQPPPSLKLRVQNQLLRPAFRYNALNADHIFSYGGKITEILTHQIGVAHDRIIEIPTGIDRSWIQDQPPHNSSPRRFVFVGRDERRKGFPELSLILRKLDGQHNFQFDFVGPLPANKQISSQQMRYHGLIRDAESIQNILKTAEVLVCPSHSEGMPNVILEGMASGCAIIATDVGAVRSMVSNENGWLIPPANPTALKMAMLASLNLSASELALRQQRSIELVDMHFCWDLVIQRTINEIARVIDKRTNH